jgi:hypothetical protein
MGLREPPRAGAYVVPALRALGCVMAAWTTTLRSWLFRFGPPGLITTALPGR